MTGWYGSGVRSLLCHDPECEGFNREAGRDVAGPCSFCGRPLVDEHGCIMLAAVSLAGPRGVDRSVWEGVCVHLGHVFEGRLVAAGMLLAGCCQRCGVGILTDGR